MFGVLSDTVGLKDSQCLFVLSTSDFQNWASLSISATVWAC